MDLAYLNRLFDFHYWARDRVLAAAALLTPEQYDHEIGSSFPSVRRTLNHIYGSEWVWFSRWQGVSPTVYLSQDQLPDLETLAAEWSEQEGRLRAFVSSLGENDVARVFEYRMMNGNPGRAKFWEMVVHLVNHGTYHRGQVTTMLRQLGASPPESTDMITFFRVMSDASR